MNLCQGGTTLLLLQTSIGNEDPGQGPVLFDQSRTTELTLDFNQCYNFGIQTISFYNISGEIQSQKNAPGFQGLVLTSGTVSSVTSPLSLPIRFNCQSQRVYGPTITVTTICTTPSFTLNPTDKQVTFTALVGLTSYTLVLNNSAVLTYKCPCPKCS